MKPSVGRKTILFTLGELLGSAFGYIALLAIGRYYDPEGFGAYTFALSAIGLVMTLSLMGFNQAHIREVARGTDPEKALGVFARIRLTLLALAVLFLLGAWWVWSSILGKGVTDATAPQVLAVILAASILNQVRFIAVQTWTGQGKVHRVQIAAAADTFVFTTFVVLTGLAFAHVLGRWTPVPGLGAAWAALMGIDARPDAVAMGVRLAYAFLAGKIAAALVCLYWWVGDGTRVGGWDRGLAREYVAFALPVALPTVMALLLKHTDVLMIGYFHDAAEVGLYSMAQRIAGLALIVNAGLRIVLLPRFSALLAQRDLEGARAVFRDTERYLLLFVVPVAAAMIALPRAGLHIAVGDGFIGAAPALQWLAAWAVVSAVILPVRQKHLGAGHTGVILRSGALNFGLNGLLNLLLIPKALGPFPLAGLGAQGAAIATFAATVAAYIYTRRAALGPFGIPLFDGVQGRLLLAGLGAWAFWYLAGAWAPGAFGRFYHLAAWGLLGLALYALMLIAMRELRREDLRQARTALSPRLLWDELRGRG